MLKSDKTRWGPARPDPTSRHDFTEVPGTQTEHLFLVSHLINSWKVYWTLGSNRSVNKEWAYLQFNLKKKAPRSTNNEDPKYLAWVLMDAVSSSEVFTNAFASCAFEPTSTHPAWSHLSCGFCFYITRFYIICFYIAQPGFVSLCISQSSPLAQNEVLSFSCHYRWWLLVSLSTCSRFSLERTDFVNHISVTWVISALNC